MRSRADAGAVNTRRRWRAGGRRTAADAADKPGNAVSAGEATPGGGSIEPHRKRL
jgi:hypothetical protein